MHFLTTVNLIFSGRVLQINLWVGSLPACFIILIRIISITTLLRLAHMNLICFGPQIKKKTNEKTKNGWIIWRYRQNPGTIRSNFFGRDAIIISVASSKIDCSSNKIHRSKFSKKYFRVHFLRNVSEKVF